MDDKKNVIHLPVNANIQPLTRENVDDAFESVQRDDVVAASIVIAVGKDGRFAVRVLHMEDKLKAFDAMLRGREYLSEWIRSQLEAE